MDCGRFGEFDYDAGKLVTAGNELEVLARLRLVAVQDQVVGRRNSGLVARGERCDHAPESRAVAVVG